MEDETALLCDKFEPANIKNRWQSPIFNSLGPEYLLHLGFLGIDFQVGMQEAYRGVCPGTSGERRGKREGQMEKLSCEALEAEAPPEAVESHGPAESFQLRQRNRLLPLKGNHGLPPWA